MSERIEMGVAGVGHVAVAVLVMAVSVMTALVMAVSVMPALVWSLTASDQLISVQRHQDRNTKIKALCLECLMPKAAEASQYAPYLKP